jgi:threonine dehydratase
LSDEGEAHVTGSSPLRPTLEEVYAARERLRGIAVRTPLLQLHGTSNIWIKPEVLQPVGSYKMRGICNAVAALPAERRADGVRTYSTGNTAQALSWSARLYGVPARAYMPTTVSPTKLRAIESYGGTPVLLPFEEAIKYFADPEYGDDPAAFVHPVANRDVIAGHGTIGLEIHEDLPDVGTVYVPVGGAGLICGVANALKALVPSVRVVGVQPRGCQPVAAALAAGGPVTVECNTICDGVAVNTMVPEMYRLVRDIVDDVVIVDDEDALAAVRRLALLNKLVAEPAGALAVAAALKHGSERDGKTIAIVSGSGIDPKLLARLLLEED